MKYKGMTAWRLDPGSKKPGGRNLKTKQGRGVLRSNLCHGESRKPEILQKGKKNLRNGEFEETEKVHKGQATYQKPHSAEIN